MPILSAKERAADIAVREATLVLQQTGSLGAYAMRHYSTLHRCMREFGSPVPPLQTLDDH